MSKFNEELNGFKQRFPFLANLTPEHLFAVMCASYFYFDGEMTRTQFENMFTDGQYDGEFDLIFNDELSDTNDLILVQSKSTTENLSKDGILAALDKMCRSFLKLKSGHYEEFNEKVKRAFINSYDQKSDLANDCFVVFTAYNPTDKIKREIDNAIQGKREFKNYKITIYYGSDIEAQISAILNPKDYIDCGQLEYFKGEGYIMLENEQGAVVNISAFDLKRLYSACSTKGLFNKNLRYFIKQKKVDDVIRHSLEKNRERFWFMNNGIIIGCEDFRFDGNKIKLSKFSIINGAQTTTLIGESQYVDKNTDFPVVCKLIKYTNDKFLDDVAEASNSQKPIGDRDLRANRAEQKNLKNELLNHKPSVNVEIKRGEKRPNKIKFREPWQRVKNEDIGQLILSFILQRPGTARSNKKSIFSVETTYNSVFCRNHDYNVLVQLLQLKTFYEQYLEKANENFDRIQSGIASNGKFCILALIGFLIKYEKNHFSDEMIKVIINGSDDRKIAENVGKDDLNNFNGKLFATNDTYIEDMESLFYELIEILSEKYQSEEENNRTTSYSNFFKTDKTYYTIIVPTLLKAYLNKQKWRIKIQEYLKAFNI